MIDIVTCGSVYTEMSGSVYTETLTSLVYQVQKLIHGLHVCRHRPPGKIFQDHELFEIIQVMIVNVFELPAHKMDRVGAGQIYADN